MRNGGEKKRTRRRRRRRKGRAKTSGVAGRPSSAFRDWIRSWSRDARQWPGRCAFRPITFPGTATSVFPPLHFEGKTQKKTCSHPFFYISVILLSFFLSWFLFFNWYALVIGPLLRSSASSRSEFHSQRIECSVGRTRVPVVGRKIGDLANCKAAGRSLRRATNQRRGGRCRWGKIGKTKPKPRSTSIAIQRSSGRGLDDEEQRNKTRTRERERNVAPAIRFPPSKWIGSAGQWRRAGEGARGRGRGSVTRRLWPFGQSATADGPPYANELGQAPE